MKNPLIYADFNNLDDDNRLRLTCKGTLNDLARQGVALQPGTVITFYTDDADDNGTPDDLLVRGVVQFNESEDCWVAAVDWQTVRHSSQDKDTQVSLTPPNSAISPQDNSLAKPLS